jgi:hypothetical protein
MGFELSPHEAAMFRRGSGGKALLVGVYVDDLVIVAAFKEEMKAAFHMSDQGPLSFYLGIDGHRGAPRRLRDHASTDRLRQARR